MAPQIEPDPQWPEDIIMRSGKLPPLDKSYSPGEAYIIQQNHVAEGDRRALVTAFNSLLHICRLDHGHLVNVITAVDGLKTEEKLRKIQKHDQELISEGKWFFPTKLVSIIKLIGKWVGWLSKFIGAGAVIWVAFKHLLGIHLP